jgi:CubicO group peptidase (beta-lactamase class C family)
MASITKLMTGVLVLQLVDRGIVDLDTPIDQYLPELSSVPPCPLTLRRLLTHTADLSWAGEWASDWNPSMENQIAQVLPYLAPGRKFTYHRSGYALTAKVLERTTGKTVPDLFDRMMLTPMGMEDSFVDNSYGGLYSTVMDLGKFGQMLLHHGSYDGHRILSEEAWRALLPARLIFAGHDLDRSWGIGCAPLGGNGLSESTFGHEAASGAVFRVDPARGLVVVVGRDKIGADYRQYERFLSRFLHAVGSPWEKH